MTDNTPENVDEVSATERWATRWDDALRMGEKMPFLQFSAIHRDEIMPGIEVVYEPFLVAQGLTPEQFFTRNMEARLATTLKAAPFVAVIGITGRFAGSLGPGVRHPQGFAVVHSDKPIPRNPADIAPYGSRVRDVTTWVLGGRLSQAFEAAGLERPEAASTQSLTTRNSDGHIWQAELRLYGGVTVNDIRAAHEVIAGELEKPALLHFEPTSIGVRVTVGAAPGPDIKWTRPEAAAAVLALKPEYAEETEVEEVRRLVKRLRALGFEATLTVAA